MMEIDISYWLYEGPGTEFVDSEEICGFKKLHRLYHIVDAICPCYDLFLEMLWENHMKEDMNGTD